MTEKEKLVALFEAAVNQCDPYECVTEPNKCPYSERERCETELIVDYLLSHDVTIGHREIDAKCPECGVKTSVYYECTNCGAKMREM